MRVYMCMCILGDTCIYVKLITESTYSGRESRTWRSLAVHVAMTMFVVGQVNVLFVCKLHGFMVN